MTFDLMRLRALRDSRSPMHAHLRQRLCDRCDALSEACGSLRLAAEALESCGGDPEASFAEVIEALEELASGLGRQLERAHAQLERCDAAEQAALEREYRNMI